MAIDLKELERRFEELFSDPNIEKQFWAWYTKKRIKENCINMKLPYTCLDKKRGKDDPCSYKVGSCYNCFNP